MTTTKNTIIVGIPYLAKGAQGRELEYALAGWRNHFKEKDYLVVVVGDHHPAVDLYDRTMHILAPRIEDPGNGEYLPALDIINKMKALHNAFPKHNGFVWAADDIYAVNNFDLADIKFLKMLEPKIDITWVGDRNPWRRMMFNTRAALASQDYPYRNFALHLPCWYEWNRIEMLIDKYDLEKKSLSIQSLYFNIFFADRIPFQLSENDNIKLGIYTKNPSPEKIREAFKHKIWLNNSVLGFVPDLYMQLEKHYGLG